jgi:hypothetical protein
MSQMQLEVLRHAPLIFFTGLSLGVSAGLLSAKTAGRFRVQAALSFLVFGIVAGIVVSLVFANL